MAKVDEQTKQEILLGLELVKQLKAEHKEKGTSVAVLLNRPKYSAINKYEKARLLRWSGEFDVMMVDENGKVVKRK